MSLTQYTEIAGLQVATELANFVADEALSGIDLTPEQFWTGFSSIVTELTAENRALLARRDDLQQQLDEFYGERAGSAIATDEHRAFLERIGYLAGDCPDFEITTTGVDAEIATIAGPQLVVPVLNARFALNAANARWGSLYDALYGTDAIAEDGGAERTTDGYNYVRGARVVAFVRSFLDEVAPLTAGSHTDASRYAVVDGALEVTGGTGLKQSIGTLAGPARLRGYTGAEAQPSTVLIEHHGLHIELCFDPDSPVGALDAAGLSDVRIESALTTIVDFEDSVAAVDADDKVAAYRNWLGLNRGTLEERVDKGGRTFVRRLAADREYQGVDGRPVTVPGRSLLLVRNVGSHMRTDAVLDGAGEQIYETMLDAALTALCAMPGRDAGQPCANGTQGSIYIVKPKMHGPDEVALAVRLFDRVETLLGLPANTIKIGIMDEERRTTLNLKAAISAARERVIFVNTGFLDRSGDEIHTAMGAGPIVAKSQMKKQVWITAYEQHNVEVAVRAGLPGRAQIGKGMWAMPDLMADMLEQKVAQLHTGASTAWVPSPSAATLHALHYHRVDVAAIQRELATTLAGAEPDRMSDLLTLPVTDAAQLDQAARSHELDDNVQSILGYVVRWVEHGVGCSKVPDLAGVALMEDRATLRISSQLLANWLAHGLISVAEISASMQRMAAVVDEQNAADPAYRPMTADPASSAAFRAATELVLAGAAQPNGYTEPILTKWRRSVKER